MRAANDGGDDRKGSHHGFVEKMPLPLLLMSLSARGILFKNQFWDQTSRFGRLLT